MTRVVTLIAAAALYVLLSARPFVAQARTIEFDDERRIIRVSEPQISPDGSQIAVVTTRADYGKDGYDSDIVLVDVATGTRRTLTYRRRDLSSLSWSESGDRLAFLALSGDGDNAADQVFVMPMSGGDPVAVTNAPNGVDQFTWRPDGEAIAYVTADDPKNKQAVENHVDDFDAGDNDFLASKPPTPEHLWVVDADGTGARRVTSGSWSVAEGAAQLGITWTPDGKPIAFEVLPDAYSSHADLGRASLVDVATGHVRPLTTSSVWTGTPIYSPDGTKMAYLIARRTSPIDEVDVAVANRDGSGAADVTKALDRNANFVVWSRDGQSLVVGADDRTTTTLWRQPIGGGAAVPMNLGGLVFFEGSIADNGALAFTGAGTTAPTELYVLDPRAAAPRKLTDLNAGISALDLGKTESIDWKGPGGFAEDGVLTYPPEYSPKKKYPMVVLIHGGPEASSSIQFSWFVQLIAARGWIAFQPNYRGSDNLGDAYMHATIGDAGPGPGKDIMAGVAAVEARGIVDPSRIGLWGWSEGGCLAAWLVTQSHQWKAAVAGAAVTNWVEEYDLSDEGYFTGELLGGSPWAPAMQQVYANNSAISFVRSATTPTLILHDTGDSRVPVSEAFEFYHALRDNHVPVRFVELPRYGHSPGDPVGFDLVFKLSLQWFDEHLR